MLTFQLGDNTIRDVPNVDKPGNSSIYDTRTGELYLSS